MKWLSEQIHIGRSYQVILRDLEPAHEVFQNGSRLFRCLALALDNFDL